LEEEQEEGLEGVVVMVEEKEVVMEGCWGWVVGMEEGVMVVGEHPPLQPLLASGT